MKGPAGPQDSDGKTCKGRLGVATETAVTGKTFVGCETPPIKASYCA